MGKSYNPMTFEDFCIIMQTSEAELDHITKKGVLDKFYKDNYLPKKDKFGRIRYEDKEKKNPLKRHAYNVTGRLRVLQDCLNSRFFSKIKLPPHLFGSVKGRSNISNAKAHQGKKYKFVTDLFNFFPSISHKRVYESFTHQGFAPKVSAYIAKLTTFKGQLPQGAPTSPFIANLVFIRYENPILEFCNNFDITYTRYVDDLTFSHQQNFYQKLPELIKMIESSGFKTHWKKSYFGTKPEIEVTGVLAKNNALKANEATIWKSIYKKSNGIVQYISNIEKANQSKS